MQDWDTVPFVDVVMIDDSSKESKCPKSHPSEVFYEVWPGAAAACDCIGSDQKKNEVKINQKCDDKSSCS